MTSLLLETVKSDDWGWNIANVWKGIHMVFLLYGILDPVNAYQQQVSVCVCVTLLNLYSCVDLPLNCVHRICLVCVAVPLLVPNPRRLVCPLHRSPVWSQPRSSSRHTCSALAQFSLTNKLKVSSLLQLCIHWEQTCAQWPSYLCVHSNHICPTCLCKLESESFTSNSAEYSESFASSTQRKLYL